MGKDYRNMVLLWDPIGLMATSENPIYLLKGLLKQSKFPHRKSHLCFQEDSN